MDEERTNAQLIEENRSLRQTEARLLQRSEELGALFKISSILGQPGTYQDKLHGVMQELARAAEAVWVTLRV